MNFEKRQRVNRLIVNIQQYHMSMKKYIITALCTGLLFLVSCNEWLDVQPKTMVEEREFYSREIGFMESLTGIYIKMANTNLYARNLSYGFLDVLGQRYQAENSIVYQDPLLYTFPSTKTEATTSSIWKGMYNTIANVNNLVKWTDKNKKAFTTPGYYEIIRGEALGLRAFLHFDLLRMYGPVYKIDPGAKRICYRSEMNHEAKEFSPANAVIDSVIRDLKAAENLLNGHDPLLFDFPQSENEELLMAGDRFLVYRHKRMNLYAVKALLARVYLYAGDKTNAAKYAQEVIDSGLFTLESNISDLLHSKEIIFSIYVDQFAKQITTEFTNNYYIVQQSFLDRIFDVAHDGTNDFRLREGVGFDYSARAISLRKYRQDEAWPSTEGTIPLIRLPEMYYILAECTDDYTLATSYLNMVRNSRGVDELPTLAGESGKLQEIEKEYRKEFYGEGQLFFFYKRHYYTTFVNCPLSTMSKKNYMFSWPEDEDLFGKTDS